MSEIEPGTQFNAVLDDSLEHTSSVKRIIILTGKIFYDVVKERARQDLTDKVALIRIEELCPFPFKELQTTLARYKNLDLPIYWLQEEPRNQGAWTHVAPRIESILTKQKNIVNTIRFIGRKEDSVPAPGVGDLYRQQQSAILEAAFKDL